MAEAIITFFTGLGWDGAAVAAVLAVIPVTELKGAILYSAARGGEVLFSVFVAYLSSVLLAAVLAFTVPRTLAVARRSALGGKMTSFLTDRLGTRADRISSNAEKTGRRREDARTFGVFAFVAIPLPLTGVWAGALLSALLGQKPKNAFFALSAGNFSAGGVVFAVAMLAGDRANIIFAAFLCLALAFLLCAILKTALTRRRRARE